MRKFSDENRNSSVCFVGGFGRTKYGALTPNDIQSARVNVLSNEKCYEKIISPLLNDRWHYHGRIPAMEAFEFEQQWCSFGDDGERSCHGDSGGPVVCLQGQ